VAGADGDAEAVPDGEGLGVPGREGPGVPGAVDGDAATVSLSVSDAGSTFGSGGPEAAAFTVNVSTSPTVADRGTVSSARSGLPGGPGRRGGSRQAAALT
jgi:hypothetical protein